ncbi:MAG: response regulator [Sulfurospirillaceae bacterium]|nr:response regulator [Sulfurospirillaceae bacterium]
MVDDYSYVEFEKAVILVTDDIEQNRTLVKECFTNTKIKVIEALNGQDAIDQVKNNMIDLILMDIRMPILDGYSATEIIKKNFDIPIIALTASIMQDDINKQKIKIFDGYLRKPVSKNELYGEVSKFLKYKIKKKEKSADIEVEDIQELKSFLNVVSLELKPSFELAKRTNDLQTISAFANDLNTLSIKHNIKCMIHFSETLLEKVDSFEIETISAMLNEYEKIMSKLIKLSNERSN